MKQNTQKNSGHHCTILEQKHLVSEMTRCDTALKPHKRQYECYLEATKNSRENNACMYS